MKVLDSGYVKLIETWGSEERIIEAARMSTDKGFLGWEKDQKLLAYLYNNNHATPFEMAGMIIEVKAPIMVFREWHRHRTQSYNEMSGRYIQIPDENYIPSIDRIKMGLVPSGNKQASGVNPLDESSIERWLSALNILYESAQVVYQMGIDCGIPKELARLPVPVARYSKMRASANLRNWLGFLTLRQDPKAQYEIRMYANAIGVLIKEHFPRTWDLYLDKDCPNPQIARIITGD